VHAGFRFRKAATKSRAVFSPDPMNCMNEASFMLFRYLLL
jgi:hypothetical protein